jgi:hypothetical protein
MFKPGAGSGAHVQQRTGGNGAMKKGIFVDHTQVFAP